MLTFGDPWLKLHEYVCIRIFKLRIVILTVRSSLLFGILMSIVDDARDWVCILIDKLEVLEISTVKISIDWFLLCTVARLF